MTLRGVIAAGLSLVLAGCAMPVAEPLPEPARAPTRDASLVVLPLNTQGARFEALLSGTLTRHGPCVYLQSPDGELSLVVWGDDVRPGRLGEVDWVVSDATTSHRFREGDWVSGGGGALPAGAIEAGWVDPLPPAECPGRLVTMHHVRPAAGAPVRAAPPPPPPAPDRGQGLTGTRFRAATRPDVAEALYRHLFDRNASGGQRSVAAFCLSMEGRDPPAGLMARFGDVRLPVMPARACEFRDVREVARATGEPALVFRIDARACASDTVCEARGGYSEANLSAATSRYRLERRGGGWTVVQDIIEVIS